MSSTTRVCHFTASKGLGRGEVYIDLANAMASPGSRVEVSILAPAGARYKSRISPDVKLVEYHSRNTRNNPFLWIEIARHLRHIKPDIVHTHFSKATELYRTVSRFVQIPFVATKHNPRKGKVYEKIDNVIAVSKVVCDSVKTGKAELIYNGIDPAAVHRQASAETEDINILCVGRLDPIKGYDKLIAMLAHIDLPWKLTILGEGEQRNALEMLVTEFNLEDRILLPGFCSDIPQQMADCDVCIFSSLSEGCSIAMLEAMNYAPLVLSTSTGLALEIYPDWLILDMENTNSLETALREYRSRQSRFREWVQPILPDLHIDHTTKQHLDLYRKIIAKSSTD